MGRLSPTDGRSRAQHDDSRPVPTVFHDGIVVPAALCAELAGALDLLEAFLRGVAPPMASRSQRLPPAVSAVRVRAWESGLEYRRRPRAFAAVSPVQPAVLAPAQTITPSVTEITTEQAATLLRLTEARVRQLAAAGTIAGRKGERNTWLLDRGSVRAYRARSPDRDHDDRPGHSHPARRGAA